MNYLGNEQAVTIFDQYLNQFGKEKNRGLLLVGRPGIGKTFLTATMAEKYGLEYDIFNASAKRRKEEIKRIYLHTQMKDSRLIVLDECEGMKTADLKKLIQKSKHPIVLCSNFIESIDYSIKQLCQVISISRPPWWTFKQYMIEYSTNQNIPIDTPILDGLAKICQSYRHAQRLVEDPDDEGIPDSLSEIDQVELSLRGHRIPHFNMSPDKLINWINDNSNDPDTISRADIMLEYSYLNSYRYWKYAYGLLNTIRSNQQVSFPSSFIRMGKVKKAHNDSSSDIVASGAAILLTESDFDTILDEIDTEYSHIIDVEEDKIFVDEPVPVIADMEEWI